jgi:putative heme-binding domain-containing protein
VQALATLGLLRSLPVDRLIAALRDPHPAVRVEALRQAENFAAGAEGEDVFRAVSALAGDGDPEVRLQAAFSLGAWPSAKAEPVLRELAARDDADEWQKVAVQSSLDPGSSLFAALATRAPLPKPVALEGSKPTSDDRIAVIAAYAGLDALPADAERGHRQFTNLCATCHRLRGEGSEVGPDLGMVGAKETSWLLHAILDPNQAVDARYRAWSVTLKSGDVVDGLVAAETANNVVLRVAGGAEHAVLRSEIVAMDALATSLMPGGFETALKPADMADLLRWLRGP